MPILTIRSFVIASSLVRLSVLGKVIVPHPAAVFFGAVILLGQGCASHKYGNARRSFESDQLWYQDSGSQAREPSSAWEGIGNKASLDESPVSLVAFQDGTSPSVNTPAVHEAVDIAIQPDSYPNGPAHASAGSTVGDTVGSGVSSRKVPETETGTSESGLQGDASQKADDPEDSLVTPEPVVDGPAEDIESELSEEPKQRTLAGKLAGLSLTDVAAAVHSTFPLLQAAYQQARVAAGEQLSAWGEFDTKLKGSSESGPLGFYETYRNSAGFNTPIYQGGEVFGGYRVGRGDFQPWYLERETNAGGEFKAGLRVPIARNREIDARRAALWRATYERQRVQPAIRSQLILFVRDASVAYWAWLAAGQKYEIGERALEYAATRNKQIERRVELGDVEPPALQDNLRAIAQREAKLIDLRRKLQQSAIKLSLFYRTQDGQPLVADANLLGGFPEPDFAFQNVEANAATAVANRPELTALDAEVNKVRVDLAEASNNLLPLFDAQLVGSQDMGAPTSSKRDKSQFELEAGLFFDMPIQRRKALGKIQSSRAKLAQLSAKRRFTVDKIVAEVQAAQTALAAAFERLEKARESKRLAEYMAEVERRKLRLGESDLLSVVLREQLAIEAAEAEVDALLEYFIARADFDAAQARDWPERPN